MWRGMLQAAGATAAFGVLHSLLASRAAKEAAAGFVGERNRDGLYRAFFNAQSTVTTGLLVAYVATRPGREFYRVRGPARAAMHAGQAAALVMMTAAAHEVGMLRFGGLRSLAAWASGGPIPLSPEAQGPGPNREGRLATGGPFRLSRHPTNFWALPVLWLWPRMTTPLLALNVAATVYLVIGSKREEERLLEAYGEEYRRYVRSGVPFFIPALPASRRVALNVAEATRGREVESRTVRRCVPRTPERSRAAEESR